MLTLLNQTKTSKKKIQIHHDNYINIKQFSKVLKNLITQFQLTTPVAPVNVTIVKKKNNFYILNTLFLLPCEQQLTAHSTTHFATTTSSAQYLANYTGVFVWLCTGQKKIFLSRNKKSINCFLISRLT